MLSFAATSTDKETDGNLCGVHRTVDHDYSMTIMADIYLVKEFILNCYLI